MHFLPLSNRWCWLQTALWVLAKAPYVTPCKPWSIVGRTRNFHCRSRFLANSSSCVLLMQRRYWFTHLTCRGRDEHQSDASSCRCFASVTDVWRHGQPGGAPSNQRRWRTDLYRGRTTLYEERAGHVWVWHCSAGEKPRLLVCLSSESPQVFLFQQEADWSRLLSLPRCLALWKLIVRRSGFSSTRACCGGRGGWAHASGSEHRYLPRTLCQNLN